MSFLSTLPQRQWLINTLLIGTILLSGCLAGVVNAQDSQTATTATSPRPLPPPSPDAARTWPKEAKELIDAMLALFRPWPQHHLSKDLIAQRTGLNFGALDGPRGSAPPIYKWAITGSPVYPGDATHGRGDLAIFKVEGGKHAAVLTVWIDKARYCINPYEFAQYADLRFTTSAPSTAHYERPGRPYRGPVRYDDQMFPVPYRYGSDRRVSIETDGKCIGWLIVSTDFIATEEITK